MILDSKNQLNNLTTNERRNDVEENLYERVKRLAKEKNISIYKLEKEAGLAPSAIAKWTKFMPTLKNAFAVANVLGITVDELIGQERRKG